MKKEYSTFIKILNVFSRKHNRGPYPEKGQLKFARKWADGRIIKACQETRHGIS